MRSGLLGMQDNVDLFLPDLYGLSTLSLNQINCYFPLRLIIHLLLLVIWFAGVCMRKSCLGY